MPPIVGLGMLHRRPLVARWFSRWRWMRASSDGPEPFPRSAGGAAMFLTSPPALKAPPAPVSTTQPTASSVSTWARTCPRADTMAWEKAFRRSGRFMVITAMPPSISARRSSVPVSSAVMSSFLSTDSSRRDWPAPGADPTRRARVPGRLPNSSPPDRGTAGSAGEQAALDRQGDGGDVAAGVAGQEDHGGRDLLVFTEPAGQCPREDLLVYVVRVVLVGHL